MSASSADELYGWLPSPCMTASRAAGAKRFINTRERGYPSSILRSLVPGALACHACVEDGGLTD